MNLNGINSNFFRYSVFIELKFNVTPEAHGLFGANGGSQVGALGYYINTEGRKLILVEALK